jgi:hypothetical protein
LHDVLPLDLVDALLSGITLGEFIKNFSASEQDRDAKVSPGLS